MRSSELAEQLHELVETMKEHDFLIASDELQKLFLDEELYPLAAELMTRKDTRKAIAFLAEAEGFGNFAVLKAVLTVEMATMVHDAVINDDDYVLSNVITSLAQAMFVAWVVREMGLDTRIQPRVCGTCGADLPPYDEVVEEYGEDYEEHVNDCPACGYRKLE